MWGVSNLGATSKWRNRESLNNEGWRAEKYAVQTDGRDLRIYNNTVVRHAPADSESPAAAPFRGQPYSFTQCGYETNATTAVLRSVQAPTSWRRLSYAGIRFQTYKMGGALDIYIPVSPDAAYLPRLEVLGPGTATKEDLESRALARRCSLERPLFGCPVEIGHGHESSFIQAITLSGFESYSPLSLYIPAADEWTARYAAFLKGLSFAFKVPGLPSYVTGLSAVVSVPTAAEPHRYSYRAAPRADKSVCLRLIAHTSGWWGRKAMELARTPMAPGQRTKIVPIDLFDLRRGRAKFDAALANIEPKINRAMVRELARRND